MNIYHGCFITFPIKFQCTYIDIIDRQTDGTRIIIFFGDLANFTSVSSNRGGQRVPIEKKERRKKIYEESRRSRIRYKYNDSGCG